MKNDNISGRQLKKQMLQILLAEDYIIRLAEISRLPPRRVVGPLFFLFVQPG